MKSQLSGKRTITAATPALAASSVRSAPASLSPVPALAHAAPTHGTAAPTLAHAAPTLGTAAPTHAPMAPSLAPPAPASVAHAPTPAPAVVPPPRLQLRAFRLKHASDPVWEYTGVPLSVLKRIFPTTFVDASRAVCDFCKKKGHPVHACPLSSADWPAPPSQELRALLQAAPRAPSDGKNDSLTNELSRLIADGMRRNADNPFRVKPNTSLYALPKRLGFWQAIGTSKAQPSWLAFGYQLRFLAPPPEVGFDNHPGAFTYAHFIDSELAKRVERGQFSIVPESFAKQIHPLDVVKKASGGFRLILDCRLINGFLPQVPFKLENLAVVPQVVAPGAWLFSTDLEDAYFHVPMHPSSLPHLCFQWRGKVYTTNVLPFGLSLAPWIFTKVLRPVIGYCRSVGISVIAYLDDFLWADGKSNIHSLVEFARALLSHLGFTVSDKKSEWTPTQILQFLGLLINSESYTFAVPKEKLSRVVGAVSALLEKHSNRSKISAKDVAGICGHILSIRLAVAPARIYTRALYSVLNTAPHWYASVQLSDAAVDELQFWKSQLPNFSSHAMIPAQFTIRLHCDASDDGWGAHCLDASAFGYFEYDQCSPLTSSTYRELRGLLFAIRTPEIAGAIRGQKVMFVLDSLAGVYNLLKGGGPKEDLSLLVKSIWRECVSLGADASAEWVSRNDNEYADYLSKYRDRSDWRINPDLFARIDNRWGPHSVDRFASSHNAHCDRFNSRYYDPGAEASDAFNQDWSGENNFCNPDFNDIGRVLEHARRHRADITLVFPAWPSALWYNTVLACASEVVRLPAFRHTFLPGPRSARTVLTAPDWPVSVARLLFSRQATNSNGSEKL